MKFEYFNGREPASNCYFIIPKCLNTDPELKKLSIDARYLYGLMLDKMKLSALNNMVDRSGKVYIYYSWEDIREDMGLSKNTILKLLDELDIESGMGLIERIKMGKGRQSRIYVMKIVEAEQNVMADECEYQDLDYLQKTKNRDSYAKESFAEYQKLDSNPKFGCTHPEIGTCNDQKMDRINKNNINKNNYNNNLIRIYPSNTMAEQMNGIRFDDDEMASRLYVRENIGTDHLCEIFPADEGKIRGIEDLIVDVLTSNRPSMKVAGEDRPTNMVKGRFMKLTSSEIETVIGKWGELTKRPNNSRAYLLAMLYNVSITADAEFEARIQEDHVSNFTVTRDDFDGLMEG